MGGWLGSGAAGGRPRPMRAWARRYRQAYRVLPAAPHATDGARPTQRWSAPHATAARSGPHAAALAARHPHGRTTLGLRDRPTTRFSSAAGRFAEARCASACDGALKNAQVWGRASGVCCERGWAATWAAGRRAGAHRPCARGRGDTGRRTESCPPRPTRPTAPAQRSDGGAPHATAARSGPHATALAARHAQGRTTLGLRDRPTTRFSSAAGRFAEARRAIGTRRRPKKRPGLGPRQRCLLRARLGGWFSSGAAGGRPPPMRAWARRYRQAYQVLPAAPHATDGARPTQRWRSAPRYGGAIRPPRYGPGGTPRAWPDHAGAEGPPNAGPHLRRWQVCEARQATARNAPEKRARFGAAPAASGAGHVGPRVNSVA